MEVAIQIGLNKGIAVINFLFFFYFVQIPLYASLIIYIYIYDVIQTLR